MDTMTAAQTVQLHVTKDYDKFNLLRGNRPIDPGHVARLKRKIENEGNLTSEFPISVNDDMEVIDGQHRLIALKELDFPVYYTVTHDTGITTVRQVNLGRRNWTWTDYAASFASEGNKHYKDLLDFYEAFGFSNHILLPYLAGGSKTRIHQYQAGEFKVLNRSLSYKLLSQLKDIREALPFHLQASAAAAFYDIMTHPDYDHQRLIDKLTKHGSQLHEWRRKKDWLRNIEDLYNLSYPENNRTRFF